MQESSEKKSCVKSSIIRKIPLPRSPYAVICTMPEKVEIMDATHYTILDYNKGQGLSFNKQTDAEQKKIYFHPTDNKMFCIHDNAHASYVNYGTKGKRRSFFHTFSSGLFCEEEPVLYMVRPQFLEQYNYDTEIHSGLSVHKKELGTLFACPSTNLRRPYFLCSDRLEKKMYKIELIKKDAEFVMQKIKIEKLFDFPFSVDLSSWVYSAQEGLFFFINKNDRMVYCFNMKGIKKQKIPHKMYRNDKGFLVDAMRLHPNGRVLVLLSEKRDIIEYVDIKNYDSIQHLKTTIHKPLGYDLYSAQKMTISHDWTKLLLADNKECCVIEIPIGIRGIWEIYFFEKTIMKMICEQSRISKDVRQVIWYFLINVLKKEYVLSDTSPIKHHEVK